MKEEHKPQNRGGKMGEGATLWTLYKHCALPNVISISDEFEDELNSIHSLVIHERLHMRLVTFSNRTIMFKSARLPPEMKSVQRAARTAGASGSGAQASGCEAAS